MLQALSRNWWLVALRGALAVIFGVLAFLWPDVTLSALVLLFGAYALVDGITALFSGVAHRDVNDRWWVLLIEGLIGVAAGIFTFIWPGITAVALLYVIIAWAIVTGVFEIVAAVRLRQQIDGEWVLALSGVASILLGVIMFISPASGVLALIWVIGAYAVLFGALMLYLGFKLRGVNEGEGATWQHA
jgi:uncharacterized membrane protein HdeD (DUF308 family)